MLKSKSVGTLLLGGVVSCSILLSTASARAGCQVVRQPVSAACPTCCAGPCMCIPNAAHWGYYTPQWQPWPGNQYRQDIVFPQSIGVEYVMAPRGTQPKPLPREKYAERPRSEPRPAPAYLNDPNARRDIQIREGLPTGPVETPLPLDVGPELKSAPQGPVSDPREPSSK